MDDWKEYLGSEALLQKRIVETQAVLDRLLAERRAVVAHLREDGRSLQWIADRFGISKTAVANVER